MLEPAGAWLPASAPVEPFLLPMPDQAFVSCPGCVPVTGSGPARLCEVAGEPAVGKEERVGEERVQEERVLYRWLLGYHVAFGVWRLLAETLARSRASRRTVVGWISRPPVRIGGGAQRAQRGVGAGLDRSRPMIL